MSYLDEGYDDFGCLSPQQYVLIYGAFIAALYKDKPPFYFSNKTEGEIQGEIAAARVQAGLWLETQIVQGAFSQKEQVRGTLVLLDLKYDVDTHKFFHRTTLRKALFDMAQIGEFTIVEKVGNLIAIDARVAIKGYDHAAYEFYEFAKFDYLVLLGDTELTSAVFSTYPLSGNQHLIAEFSEKLSSIRHRISVFYTEWLRGQIKIISRLNDSKFLPD